MYIFIDESGGFQSTARTSQVSCVAALVVPEPFARTLFRKFRRLSESWKAGQLEAKGSQLTEQNVADLLRLVRKFDVLLLVAAIDMGLHTEQGIKDHKEEQADKVVSGVPGTMPVHMRQRIERLGAAVRALPNQLYVQSVVLTTLLENVVDACTLYYVQRIPRTLGSFVWRLDAKDIIPTHYEAVWREIVGPQLQTRSIKKPMAQLEGADYSSFDRFGGRRAQAPAYLRRHVTDQSRPFEYLDIDELLGDLKFVPSHRLTGLQMVDMLAAAVRRGCNGTLQTSGCKGLGRLMPTPERGHNCIRLLALEDIEYDGLPYASLIKSWGRETKRMVI
jgi:hypothetical protein